MRIPEMYMLRFGEMALKGRNRKLFVKDLIRILKPRIAPLGGRIEKGHKRLILHCEAEPERVREAFSTVFGLVGISPVWRTTHSMDAIKELCWELIEPFKNSGKSFAVRARRGLKNFPMTSPEIAREIGAHLLINEIGLPVNLSKPDLTLSVTMDVKSSWCFLETWPGLGGLPNRPREKHGLLLSGGIDSPVAGYQMQRRGATMTPIYFHTPPYTVEEAREKVLDLAEILARYQNGLDLHIVNFTAAMQAIRAECNSAATVVLSRRLMMRIASRIMRKERGKALITGENLGQVASQTIDNIAAVNEGVPYPILRPLISMDKLEIMAIARRIGSYDVSIRPAQDCCSLFSPKNPLTRAHIPKIHVEESFLDMEALVEEALELTEVVRFETN